jgi:hypothetical protein
MLTKSNAIGSSANVPNHNELTCVIKILFYRVKSDFFYLNKPGGQFHVRGTVLLCPPKQGFVQDLIFEKEHRPPAISAVAFALYRVENVLVKVRVMLYPPVATSFAHASMDTVMHTLTIAAFGCLIRKSNVV